MKIGDKVKYSRTFLRSIGMFTGDMCFAKGTVTLVKDLGSVKIVTVEWDTPDVPSKVAAGNLVKVGQLESV